MRERVHSEETEGDEARGAGGSAGCMCGGKAVECLHPHSRSWSPGSLPHGPSQGESLTGMDFSRASLSSLNLSLTAEAWAGQEFPAGKLTFPTCGIPSRVQGGQPARGTVTKGVHWLEKFKAIIKLPNSRAPFYYHYTLAVLNNGTTLVCHRCLPGQNHCSKPTSKQPRGEMHMPAQSQGW